MIELKNKRTANSKTFDLGEDKRRVVIGYTHYQDEKGEWQDCDLESESLEGYDAFYKHLPLPTALKQSGARRIYLDKKKYVEFGELKPVGDVVKGVSSLTSAKAEIINDDYKIEYLVTDMGSKFNLTLLNDKAPLKWEMSYKEFGCSFKDGILTDGKTEVKMTDIIYWGRKDISKAKTVKFEIKDEKITFEIDVKEMEYPIIVDPTVVANDNDDTTLAQGNSSNNYSSIGFIWVQLNTGNIARTVIRKDWSAVPTGKTIDSATLSLYRYNYGGVEDTNNPSNVEVRRIINTGFIATSATWNKKKTGTNWNTAGCGNTTTDHTETNKATSNCAGYTQHTWDVKDQLVA